MQADVVADLISADFASAMAEIETAMTTPPPDLRTVAGLTEYAATLDRVAALSASSAERLRIMAMILDGMRREAEAAGLSPDVHLRLVKG